MNHKMFFSIIAITTIGAALLFSTCKKNNDPKAVTSVMLNKDALSLTVGETATLVATILPKDATNKAVTWMSSDSIVATVSNKGLVKALKSGIAVITVITKDGGEIAICNVVARYNWEPEMVFVEPGTFTMGCTNEQGDDCFGDLPVHQVTLTKGYYIGKYEVTQAQWVAVMGNNPSYFKGDNLPVEQVNWYDIQDFITRLNGLTEKNYRLPTEAEWEYACRGGVQSVHHKYSGSNNIDDVAWYWDGETYEGQTHPVGTKLPNELGIYNMSGNVWEWCNDWYGAYSDEAQTDPQGPVKGGDRIWRGGSWSSVAASCRVSFREHASQSNRLHHLGFRIALSF